MFCFRNCSNNRACQTYPIRIADVQKWTSMKKGSCQLLCTSTRKIPPPLIRFPLLYSTYCTIFILNFQSEFFIKFVISKITSAQIPNAEYFHVQGTFKETQPFAWLPIQVKEGWCNCNDRILLHRTKIWDIFSKKKKNVPERDIEWRFKIGIGDLHADELWFPLECIRIPQSVN